MFMPMIKPQVYSKFNRRFVHFQPHVSENPNMANLVGNKIKIALKNKGETQHWLAETTGVSDNAVAKWIREGKIKKENITRIARALDISPTELIEGAESMPYTHPDPKIKAMMRAMENMTEYQKDTLIKISTALDQPEKPNGTK